MSNVLQSSCDWLKIVARLRLTSASARSMPVAFEQNNNISTSCSIVVMAAVFGGCERIFARTQTCSTLFKHLFTDYFRTIKIRSCHSEVHVPLVNSNVPESPSPEFGLFFDIDGVITRGRTLLPHSKDAFKLLTDENGRFIVPAVFVTNAGNSMRQSKAKQLSDWLGIQIDPEQVVMSHSPLRMFKQFLDKHMLLSGQGPIEEIAKFLGFSKYTTLDTFAQCFPGLDAVDHKRRKAAPCAFENYFPKIEGLIMFGEPVRWEMGLQLIIDVLVSNGRPSQVITEIPYPHLPVLACNMDLVWMSEAPMPRFGHGCFMNCLETLYKKITGFDLKYTAKVGKPSEITYHYAEHVLQSVARKMNLPPIRKMYCIGDNPSTDIYGANLFNQRIHRLAEKRNQPTVLATTAAGQPVVQPMINNVVDFLIPDFDHDPSITEYMLVTIENCESILVCTGVFDQSRSQIQMTTDHIMDVGLCVPSFTTVHNVLEAVSAVLAKEGMLRMRK